MSTGAARLLLVASGLLDVAWAISVKYADGYTRPWWSILSFVLLVGFVFALGRALQVLPVGTAYVVWTGIGVVGTVTLGMVLFREPTTAVRLIWIGVIFFGIVGLRLSSA